MASLVGIGRVFNADKARARYADARWFTLAYKQGYSMALSAAAQIVGKGWVGSGLPHLLRNVLLASLWAGPYIAWATVIIIPPPFLTIISLIKLILDSKNGEVRFWTHASISVPL